MDAIFLITQLKDLKLKIKCNTTHQGYITNTEEIIDHINNLINIALKERTQDINRHKAVMQKKKKEKLKQQRLKNEFKQLQAETERLLNLKYPK